MNIWAYYAAFEICVQERCSIIFSGIKASIFLLPNSPEYIPNKDPRCASATGVFMGAEISLLSCFLAVVCILDFSRIGISFVP